MSCPVIYFWTGLNKNNFINIKYEKDLQNKATPDLVFLPFLPNIYHALHHYPLALNRSLLDDKKNVQGGYGYYCHVLNNIVRRTACTES